AGHPDRTEQHLPALPARRHRADLHAVGPDGVRLRQLPIPAGIGRRPAVHRRRPARTRGPGGAADPVPLDQVDNAIYLTGRLPGAVTLFPDSELSFSKL